VLNTEPYQIIERHYPEFRDVMAMQGKSLPLHVHFHMLFLDGVYTTTPYMNLPVIVDGKIVLVAGVGNKEENYTQSDVQQLSLLMEGMWRLVERKRAEEELERYHNQLEDTVRRRTEELKLSRDAAESANKAIRDTLVSRY
jgi:GAF domain-containing protein